MVPKRQVLQRMEEPAAEAVVSPSPMAAWRAAIYARVSQDQRGTGRSVQQQVTEGRGTVARERWTLRGVWVDNSRGASKYSRGEREAWKELRQLIEAGEIDVLVVWEPSRLTRDRMVWATLAHICEEKGIRIAASGRVYDLSDPDDAFSLDLYFALGVREVGMTRKRVMRDHGHQAAAGQPHGRLLYGYYRVYDETTKAFVRQVKDDRPRVNLWALNVALFLAAADSPQLWATPLGRWALGYRPRDQKDLLNTDRRKQLPWWVRDPLIGPDKPLLRYTREQVVDEIMRVGLKGISEYTITRNLNLLGLPTATGGFWGPSSVRKMLTNPGYAGLRRHHDSLYRAVWPGYIEVEDHYALVARYDPPKSGKPRREHRVKHLLSGLLTCSVCGSATNVQHNRQRGTRSYLCAGKGHRPEKAGCTARPKELTELYVTELVIEWLSSPEAAQALMADERSAVDLRKLVDRRESLENRLQELYDNAGVNGASDRLLAATERNLKAEIETLNSQIEAKQRFPVLRDLVLPDRVDVEAAWDRLDLGRKREVIRALFVSLESLKVGRGQRGGPIEGTIRVTWRDFDAS